MVDYEQMKRQAEEEQDKIELRSEKIRNIIGQMPPFLIRWGNTVLLVLFLLLAVLFLIFYW
ncbi:hypothetical protein [uncultured Parabacteroides sp.]|uniref:hypothetical protein n=1 Tax=uncultured Parabacteroides sp. TaxID=512312 RepID=UPI0025F5CE49|nr:hypothetical protein [uncultured Parabacteroides sp.]